MWNDAADEWPVGVLQLPALSTRSMALGGRREEEREEEAAEEEREEEAAEEEREEEEAEGGAPPAASIFFFSFSARVAWGSRGGEGFA
jgi:hypothetical protein